MYALIGEGINPRTVRLAGELVTGPCSCQVKAHTAVARRGGRGGARPGRRGGRLGGARPGVPAPWTASSVTLPSDVPEAILA